MYQSNRSYAAWTALLVVAASAAAHAQTAARPMTKVVSAKPVAGKARVSATAANVLTLIADQLWETGDKYWHDGDYNRVVGLGRVVMEIDPSDAEVADSVAWLLWSMDDPKGADDLLQYAISKSPKSGNLYANLGGHLFRTKRYKEAISYLAKAIALGDVPFTAYSFLGHAYTRLGLFQEAVETWRACVEKFPKYPAGPKNLKDAETKLQKSK